MQQDSAPAWKIINRYVLAVKKQNNIATPHFSVLTFQSIMAVASRNVQRRKQIVFALMESPNQYIVIKIPIVLLLLRVFPYVQPI